MSDSKKCEKCLCCDAGLDYEEKAFYVSQEIERKRIIKLLTDLNVIRRDALGHLVAFNTDGTEVVYLTGLENK